MYFPTDRLHFIFLLCCLILLQEKKKTNEREKSTLSDQTAKEIPHDLLEKWKSCSFFHVLHQCLSEWCGNTSMRKEKFHMMQELAFGNSIWYRKHILFESEITYFWLKLWKLFLFNLRNVLSYSSRSIIFVGFISALAKMPKKLPVP